MTQERTLSKDTNTALREIMSTIKSMEKVFIEETKALNNTDNDTFMAMQGKKLIVAREYQNDMSQILARKNEIKNADKVIKNTLDEMQKKFSKTSSENINAINRMQRCTERLGNTIRNAAIRDAQKQHNYSYGENGAIVKSNKNRAVSTGLSESV